MADRKKKQDRTPLTPLGFVGRWMATYVMGWIGLLGAAVVLLPLIYVLVGALPLWLALLVAGGIAVGRLVGEAQAHLLRRQFGTAPHSWKTLSGGSWLFLGMGLAQVFIAGSLPHAAVFAALFALPALVQAHALRHTLPQTWLWVLASITSGVIFSLPLAAGLPLTLGVLGAALGVGGLLHGAVMGMTLMWLFNSSANRPAPPATAQADDADERLARLQSSEERVLSRSLVRDHIDRVQQRRGR